MKYAPLFLVSAAAIGVETAMTRYFAVASWSDYGYWVISIVMAGFALSGIVLALARDALLRRAQTLLAILPAILVATLGLGYCGVILNPFNPLQLQNPATYAPQLVNIGLYYLALLPFFFAAGLFIALNFVTDPASPGRVYAADLAGAAAGCVLVLGLMYFIAPFRLVPALLPLLAAAAWFVPAARLRASLAATLALIAAEALLALGPQASISQYKPIYPPLHTPGAQILATIERPAGEFLLLDDFTERVNTDISNDSAMLGYPDPPRSFGLYRDGIRIISLPRPGQLSPGYAPGALDAAPYHLIPHPDTLLIGASGGFRIAETLALGAAHVTALEPEPVLFTALTNGLGPSPAYPADPRVTLTHADPRAAVAGPVAYNIIDISADFMDASPANVYAFSAESLAAYLAHLTPGGILSVPVSIEDFPAYGLRMLASLRAALAIEHIANPAPYIIVYRSAWNARILASRTPFTAAQIASIAKWCDDRSFDISFYNGMDVAAARDDLYNDLPAVSFAAGTITSYGADDSIADEAGAILGGRPTISAQAFDLRPVRDDRPAFYAILRLDQLSLLLARLQILPQAEIGALVNLAVLAQALLLAALVLACALAGPKRRGGQRRAIPRTAAYFSALALGFLFLEIYGIETASRLLDDRAAGFALVLSTMLAGSGAGSFLSGRLQAPPARAVRLAVLAILAWAMFIGLVAIPLLPAGSPLPFALRAALVVLAMFPVSLAMGIPFPLGLQALEGGFLLPWAWGLNGAVSVAATPLANLTLRNIGLHAVLGGAVVMYGVAALSFPAFRREQVWYRFFKRSAAAQ